MNISSRLFFAAIAAAILTLAAASSETQARKVRVLRDGRTVIHLSAVNRVHFRKGMRVYLESIEGIIDGMTQHKMGLVAKAAKKSGMNMIKDVSLETALGLPPEFILMSADTHEKFDELAKTARTNRVSKLQIMEQLSTILGACTSCHSAFRLTPQ